MKLNKLFHDDKEWVEYKVYKKSLMQKDSSYAEILFDKDLTIRKQAEEIKELRNKLRAFVMTSYKSYESILEEIDEEVEAAKGKIK